MNIELKNVTVRELTEGYKESEEEGVRAYGGRLDVRPAYQREFIYKDEQREKVITTVLREFPLNVMYWVVRDNDTEVPYEVMDGQQRTISLCQYVTGQFSHKGKFFHSLTSDEKHRILDYELMVYVCSGTDREKLDWFETINIAGEKLLPQELRNAIYAGPFISDAKRYFSKNGCAAKENAGDIMTGTPIRQDYLETVLKWKIRSEGKDPTEENIKEYMSKHQLDPNASQLWQYFSAVITWINDTFDVKERKNIIKGLDLGQLYDQHHHRMLDRDELDKEIGRLLIDSEVQNNKGIIPYVLTRDEHCLNLRAFPEDIKLAVYEKQQGICPICGQHYELKEMDADHIVPWSKGGRTVEDNCQMLCRRDNHRKSAK